MCLKEVISGFGIVSALVGFAWLSQDWSVASQVHPNLDQRNSDIPLHRPPPITCAFWRIRVRVSRDDSVVRQIGVSLRLEEEVAGITGLWTNIHPALWLKVLFFSDRCLQEITFAVYRQGLAST